MTKARTKGQKLAERRRRAMLAAAPEGLPELAPVQRRYQSGRKVTADRDPQRTVLKARCAHMGKDDSKENRRMMKMAMMGDQAGQAIAIGSTGPKEAARLWQAFTTLDAADEVYHRRILGRSRHAKCGKVEFMPERFEARPDDKPSYRTEEQKDAAAVKAWMQWHGAVGHLASHEQSAIWDGVYLRGELQRGGVLTTMGSAFVQALRILSAVSATKGLI